jgi:hypothetical protein
MNSSTRFNRAGGAPVPGISATIPADKSASLRQAWIDKIIGVLVYLLVLLTPCPASSLGDVEGRQLR